MESYEKIETMEAIARRFLSQNDNIKQGRQDSISTLKDMEIFGKMPPTIVHTRTRSKVLSIISNNIVLAEYNFDYFNNKKVLYKIPSKEIDDHDVSWEDDMENHDDLTGETLNEEFIEVNYEGVYWSISELYRHFIVIRETFEDFSYSLQLSIQKIEKWINKDSPFIYLMNTKKEFYYQNLYEIILVGYIIFLYEIISTPGKENHKTFTKENIEGIYHSVFESLGKLYENIILLLTYTSANKTFSTNISFEELCQQYVNEFYKTNTKRAREQIFTKIQENLDEINELLSQVTEMVVNLKYKSVNSLEPGHNSVDCTEEKNYFKKLKLILKKNQENSEVELKSSVINQLHNLKNLVEKSAKPNPFLPPLDYKKYKYSLVLDLDETLVHYVEDEEKAYVQVRPYAESFLFEMGKYFEIVIFTSAASDYADIVLQSLDKTNSISHRLYREHTIQKNGVYLKDLSKLGRNIKTIFIIDNNKDNFSLQPDNGLNISSFMGEKNDNELFLLSKDLMKIISDTTDDIRPVLTIIRELMFQRYTEPE